eukprot:1178549-Prymnesium_polylepis.1
MVHATTSLLSLGVRRWAGRPMCDSLVRRARASPGSDRLVRARAGRELHTHQVARAVKPVQSRRDACRAIVLMKLSAAPHGGAARSFRRRAATAAVADCGCRG